MGSNAVPIQALPAAGQAPEKQPGAPKVHGPETVGVRVGAGVGVEVIAGGSVATITGVDVIPGTEVDVLAGVLVAVGHAGLATGILFPPIQRLGIKADPIPQAGGSNAGFGASTHVP
jgi:hypothetical protein